MTEGEKAFKKLNELQEILESQDTSTNKSQDIKKEVEVVSSIIKKLQEKICNVVPEAEKAFKEALNELEVILNEPQDIKKEVEVEAVSSIIKKLQEKVCSLFDKLLEQRVRALIGKGTLLTEESIRKGCALVKPSSEKDLRILEKIKALDAPLSTSITNTTAKRDQFSGLSANEKSNLAPFDDQKKINTRFLVVRFEEHEKNIVSVINSHIGNMAYALGEIRSQCFADIMRRSLTKKKELSDREKDKYARTALAKVFDAVKEQTLKAQERLKYEGNINSGIDELFRIIESYKKDYDANTKTVKCRLTGNELKQKYFEKLHKENNRLILKNQLQERKQSIDWLIEKCKDYLPEQISVSEKCFLFEKVKVIDALPSTPIIETTTECDQLSALSANEKSNLALFDDQKKINSRFLVVRFEEHEKNIERVINNSIGNTDGCALDEITLAPLIGIMKESLSKKEELSDDEKTPYAEVVLAKLSEAANEAFSKNQDRLLKKRLGISQSDILHELFKKVQSMKKEYNKEITKTVACSLTGKDLKQAYFNKLHRDNRLNLIKQLCQYGFSTDKYANAQDFVNTPAEDSEKKLNKLEKMIGRSSDKHKDKAKAKLSLKRYKETEQSITWFAQICTDYLPEQINIYKGCLTVTALDSVASSPSKTGGVKNNRAVPSIFFPRGNELDNTRKETKIDSFLSCWCGVFG